MASFVSASTISVVNGAHTAQVNPIQNGELSGRKVQPANGHHPIANGAHQVASLKRKMSQENGNVAKQAKVEEEKEVQVKKPIFKLANCFAGDDGWITIPSVTRKLTSLHINFFEAGFIAIGFSAAIGSAANGVPFSSVHIDNAAKLLKENEDSIITPNGINQNALERLFEYAQPGKDYLSASDIEKMLNDYKAKDMVIYNATYQQFSILQRLCHHHEKIDGKFVQCLSKDVIRQFYNDPESLFKRVENKELPIPQPAN